MFRTLVRRAGGRKPLIKFPDRSKAVQEPHTPHPHPAAPSEIADNFSSFQKTLDSGPHFDANKLKDFKTLAAEMAYPVGAVTPHGPVQTGKLESAGRTASAGSGSGQSKDGRTDVPVAEDLHDLPPRFWKTPTLFLEEAEMEAVMTGGANLVQ